MHSLSDKDDLKLVQRCQWNENRLKPGQSFVGLAVSEGCVCVMPISRSRLTRTGYSNRRIYSCTSNGALRLTKAEELQHSLAALPMRLRCWRLSPDGESFVYGGDEVEISLWDAQRTFNSPTNPTQATSEKRKRGSELLPAETWRAKNVSPTGSVVILTH